MSLVYSTTPQHTSAGYPSSLAPHITSPQQNSMDRGASEYTQSGLPTTSYPEFTELKSEDSSADHPGSAAQYHPSGEVRSQNFSSSATPTSEYGLNPSSARSGSFPEYLRPTYQDQGAPRYNPGGSSGSSGGMAQTSSPPLVLADAQHNGNSQSKSDPEIPIDPSIAASSPTYPPQGQYSPYGAQPPHDMAYQQHPGSGYGGHWNGSYGQPGPHGMPGPYAAHPSPTTAASAAGQTITAGARGQAVQSHPLSQVYSFVPIPGAQQHKRPRRRYEEIERMYKCGFQGCEKAYGTLNHLNAHVTMQSHGPKRTPEGELRYFYILLDLFHYFVITVGACCGRRPSGRDV
jgi:transcription factor CON7